MTNERPTCAIVASEHPGELLANLASCIAARGVVVSWLNEPLPRNGDQNDLILLRAKTEGAIRWAKMKHDQGIQVFPDPFAVEAVKDRWTCRRLLQSSGLNLPEAIIGESTAEFRSSAGRLLPLILKQRRVHGRPVRFISSQKDLAGHLTSLGLGIELIAERFVIGCHYTVYFIGSATFVFEKAALLGDSSEHSVVVSPPPGVLEIVEKYKTSTGLHLGKIDFVKDENGLPWCVDFGVFPGFRNVPGAATLIADLAIGSISESSKLIRP